MRITLELTEVHDKDRKKFLEKAAHTVDYCIDKIFERYPVTDAERISILSNVYTKCKGKYTLNKLKDNEDKIKSKEDFLEDIMNGLCDMEYAYLEKYIDILLNNESSHVKEQPTIFPSKKRNI